MSAPIDWAAVRATFRQRQEELQRELAAVQACLDAMPLPPAGELAVLATTARVGRRAREVAARIATEPPAPAADLVTYADAAAHFGVNRTAVYTAVHKGRVKRHVGKNRKDVLVSLAELSTYNFHKPRKSKRGG